MPATLISSPRKPPVTIVDIVDVGHGNCVVVRVGERVSLIDTGPNGAILEYLREQEIDQLETIILSHADADHIGGLSAILAQNIPVREIIWNPDSLKDSALWGDLKFEIEDRHNAGLTSAARNATQDLRVEVADSEVTLIILAPGVGLQHAGPGGRDRHGRRTSTNSASVVVRIDSGDVPVALIPGDIDDIGLTAIFDANRQHLLQAHALVLPHHGGMHGDPDVTKEATTRLIEAVTPEAIFVSNGRNKFNNPQPIVMAALQEHAPSARVSCTQLSKTCSKDLLRQKVSPAAYSRGWSDGSACAGTMRLSIDNENVITQEHSVHDSFLSGNLPARLCAVRAGSVRVGSLKPPSTISDQA